MKVDREKIFDDLIDMDISDALKRKKGELFGYIPYTLKSTYINNDGEDNYALNFYLETDSLVEDFDYPLIFRSNGNGTAEELISGKTFMIGFHDFSFTNEKLKKMYFYDEKYKNLEEQSRTKAYCLAYKEIRNNPLTISDDSFFEVDDNFKYMYTLTYANKDLVKSIIDETEEKAKEKCDSELQKSIDRIHEYALMENFIIDNSKTR